MKTGFTLVELLVSIALVLVLMVGVNQVFKTTTQTVAANQGISENTRAARSAQGIFANDFNSMVTTNDAPFIVLQSSRVSAFRNRADDLSDLKTTKFKASDELSTDLNGNNIEGEATVPGERISAATYNYRSHRVDILSFFARGLFRRQAGNPGENMISPMSGSEAFISYGHLKIWNGLGSLNSAQQFVDPNFGTYSGGTALTTNPNNWYATQFVLGRTAIVMSDGTSTDTDSYADVIYDQVGPPPGTPQRFAHRPSSANGQNLSPLAVSSGLNIGTQVIQQSMTDLAGITMAQMRELVSNYIANIQPAGTYLPDWYSRFAYRFDANPLMPKPINVDTLAQTVPTFLPGCTQFIVEYAGDFLKQQTDPTQANYGDVLDTCYDTTTGAQLPTDGQIDFVVVNGGRKIRWYGMPRDASGDGVITGGLGATQATLRANEDVIPLRDYWQLVAREAASAAPFEKDILPPAANAVTKRANYSDVVTSGGNLGMGVNQVYTCAWAPNDPKPRMIRIIFTLDDPNGRLPGNDGQTFELVFELP